jgi:hypothetical protein
MTPSLAPTRHVSPLAHLVADGVLVRTAGRLRVSSRFLAAAERASAHAPGLHASLAAALRAHGYGGDVPTAVGYLTDFMAERGQAGLLQPVFGMPRLAVPA